MPGNELSEIVHAAARVCTDSSDFDLNADFPGPAPDALRPAAVLMPLVETPRGLAMILTKRAAALEHHPGQIAFPGGKIDATDTDAIAAALREAEEEIGLPRKNVEILGVLPRHRTITGFSVTPVLGRVTAGFEPIAETGEVDEVFSVPCRFLMQPDNFSVQSRLWQGKRRFYYTIPWGPYYIWGATARILRALAEGGSDAAAN
ncbi:MAG TPA: CoA pyrophosphatase [Aliiroseovarius sp.]|nr:CoA pyrophosphatase [Aliiroseovarius sp.]